MPAVTVAAVLPLNGFLTPCCTAAILPQARELMMKGCEMCPNNEDVWLEAARLQVCINRALVVVGLVADVSGCAGRGGPPVGACISWAPGGEWVWTAGELRWGAGKGLQTGCTQL